MNQSDIILTFGDFKRYISYLWNNADDIFDENNKFKVEGYNKISLKMNDLEEIAEVHGQNSENLKEIDKLICEADMYTTDKINVEDSDEKENRVAANYDKRKSDMLVSYLKNGNKFWELIHLKNIKKVHLEMNRNRSAIVHNALKESDLVTTVRDFQKYIIYLLAAEVDFDEDQINEFNNIQYDIDKLDETAQMQGWNYDNIKEIDNLVFEVEKYKAKFEEHQVVDPRCEDMLYDDT